MRRINGSWWAVPALFGAALLLAQFSPTGPGNNAQAAGPARNASELTAQWWQWVLGIPASENPLLDETGEDAAVGQPYKGNKVFFLVGVFNESGTAERSITVPRGTAFFFPVLNVLWRYERGVDVETVPEIYAILGEVIDEEVDYVYVTLDGIDLTAFSKRVASPPFAVRLPDDNISGAPAGVYAPSVSDGYWFYLPPLSQGTHTLTFGGSAFGGGFVLDITYHITVE